MKERRIIIMFLLPHLGEGKQAGGAERQLLELVKGINKDKFEPLIVTLHPGGILFEEACQIPDVQVISVDRKGKYDFGVLARIYSLLRQRKVDIIQPFLTPATFFGLLPALINRTPVKIVTERGGRLYHEKFGFKMYKKTEDFLTRFTDVVIANSEAGREYLVSRGINQALIKVIYNGINFDRLIPDQVKVNKIRSQFGMPSDGIVIGMTSVLRHDKDYPTFLQGAKIILQVMPQTRFAILGDGPSRTDIENIVKDLGLSPYVTFFGHQQDVASFISCYDVACLCSKYSEGCSNVILESMFLGKPVVASDVGGNRELVENSDCGLLVPARDPQAFANAVLTLLKQPDRAQEMGERGRNKVMTRFSLHRMVHDYEELFEQALQAKRRE